MALPAARARVYIGAASVTYLPDGIGILDRAVTFPASKPADWARHADCLAADDRLLMSYGAFLIRTGTRHILVDRRPHRPSRNQTHLRQCPPSRRRRRMDLLARRRTPCGESQGSTRSSRVTPAGTLRHATGSQPDHEPLSTYKSAVQVCPSRVRWAR